jgi:hypothetical protein
MAPFFSFWGSVKEIKLKQEGIFTHIRIDSSKLKIRNSRKGAPRSCNCIIVLIAGLLDLQ